jgi:hypothetical protein
VDENLRTVLLLMTTDREVASGLALRPTSALAAAVTDRCMELLALGGPVAGDLRWAMAVIRVGKDYERVQELAEALAGRVSWLGETMLDEVLHATTAVMGEILRLHAVLLELWEDRRAWPQGGEGRLARHRQSVFCGVKDAEDLALAALMAGEERPENLKELVLAMRHVRRIASLLAEIPDELRGGPPGRDPTLPFPSLPP